LEFILDKIEGGIGSGRLCASVLVVPRRKTSLFRAQHGRAAMARLELMDGGHGGSREREGGGKGRGRRQGALLGVPCGAARGTMGGCSSLFGPCCVLNVRKKKRRRKERRKRKFRKRKEKIGNFSKLKIFGEKNKRQFMKLVKIIFLKERYMPNYK
jgi:hypothetical protein